MPSITRVGCNKLMNEVGYVLFEELGSISLEEASVLRDVISQTVNKEYLEGINGKQGVIDLGASNFSTHDKQDFVLGTYEECAE